MTLTTTPPAVDAPADDEPVSIGTFTTTLAEIIHIHPWPADYDQPYTPGTPGGDAA